MDKTKEELAEEHAEWFSKMTKYIYFQAFVHGYKHGEETASKGD